MPPPARGWRRGPSWPGSSSRSRPPECAVAASSEFLSCDEGRGARSAGVELGNVASTQTALYRELVGDGLQLSWSEAELPERERTKHVHRLHPYLGKFIPQLVEALLGRYVRRGGRVLDPFAGSGTTLVQALESGYDADGDRHRGVQLPADARQDRALRPVPAREGAARRIRPARALACAWERLRPSLVRAASGGELLHFRRLLEGYEHADVLRVVLARAARSARLTSHFDLDFPRDPQREPYWCHKHRRTCTPVEEADKFIARYLLDTLERLKAFQRIRDAHPCRGRAARGRAGARPRRAVRRGSHVASVPGSHRLPRAAPLRVRAPLGSTTGGSASSVRPREERAEPPWRSTSTASPASSPTASAHSPPTLRSSSSSTTVATCTRRSSGERAFEVVDRLERHVNRRTGRRAGEYFESVFVAVASGQEMNPQRHSKASRKGTV